MHPTVLASQPNLLHFLASSISSAHLVRAEELLRIRLVCSGKAGFFVDGVVCAT
jgi:hypothetical protein